jgi:hypothetical protein
VNVYVSCFQALFSSRQPFILRKLEAKALSSSPYRTPSGGPLLQWWALINIINFFNERIYQGTNILSLSLFLSFM